MKPRLEDVLGRRLREVAAQRKLPLSHVADRAGIARSHFWLVLDGEVSTSLAVVQKLAEVLGVRPTELLTLDDHADPRAKSRTLGPVVPNPKRTRR